jgi:transcriptional regulator with XRE-family HTH domain
LLKLHKIGVVVLTGKEFVQYVEANLLVKAISKELFYKESGITTASMSQWRSGKHNPSEKAIKRAEDFFNKFPNKRGYLAIQDAPLLKSSDVIKTESPTPEGMELTEAQQNAINIVMQLSDAQLNRFIKLAEILLEESSK